MSDLYHDLLIEEARHPQSYGELVDADVVLEEFNASCGDKVQIYLKLSEDQQTIKQLRWTGEGCVISQAAMSVLAGLVANNGQVKQLKKVTITDLEKLLGVEDISPGRIKCINLGLMALKKWQATDGGDGRAANATRG